MINENIIIELKNVEVTYKERISLFKCEKYTALKDISFNVFKGETLGIIGRNGAGKSTLLRILAGIIKPDSGSVTHYTTSISLMALQAGFDPNLSGRQNSIISGMLLGHSLANVKLLLEDIKEYSDLNDFFEKPIKNYSSGMLARLGFSIAMFTTPDVLLIDEVLGVGDVNFAKKAEKSIKEKISSDTTVVIVSHSEAQLKDLADRLVCIENGVVTDEGKSSLVYTKYNFMMRLTSYNLNLTKFKNDFDLNFDIMSINTQELYFDMELRFSNFTSINSKVYFENDFNNLDELEIDNNGTCWIRVIYRREYIINIDSLDNKKQTISFQIDNK